METSLGSKMTIFTEVKFEVLNENPRTKLVRCKPEFLFDVLNVHVHKHNWNIGNFSFIEGSFLVYFYYTEGQ